MGLEIDKSDKPVMVLALSGFAFTLGLVIFMAANWMKPSEDVNWWFFLPVLPGALAMIGTMAYMILIGLYRMGILVKGVQDGRNDCCKKNKL